MNRKRLKIGIIIDSYYPEIDGVVMVADNLACALAEFNDVTMIIPDMHTKKLYKRPYEIIRVKSIPVPFSGYNAGMLTVLSKEYKQILNKHFDVIHIQSPFIMGKAGIKIARKQNIPVFSTFHSSYAQEIQRYVKSGLLAKITMKYVMSVFNATDKCIAVSEPLTDEMKSQGYKHEPIVIHNGTDITPPKNKLQSLRAVNKRYGLNENDTVFVFVGRITPTKNIYFLLDSLKLLKQDNVKFKMLFVGFGPDEAKLRAKIKEYDMDDCVIMTGKISDRKLLSAVYARSDLLLFPSVTDTFALVKPEAAVNETPGLFIENTMTVSDVRDNVNGFLSPENVVAFKDRIKQIIGDKELLKEVSVNARETLAQTWMTIALKHHDEYIKANRKKKSAYPRCKK